MTVFDSSYGPYIGLPLSPTWEPTSAHLFTRKTADLIVRDLNGEATDTTGTFTDDGTLLFTVEPGANGPGETITVTPDEHGRYPIGGLWWWDVWGDHVPHTAGQAAFARGAAEYQQADAATSLPQPLDGLYTMGREEARRLTQHAAAS
ncbi:hypothetical protein ACH4UR_37235 [Streptomyces lydicus]|uniref:hypothetical protein n=1 Tax=Streptomyces lydicus TaxID=47763 RepID=UPI0033E4FC1B